MTKLYEIRINMDVAWVPYGYVDDPAKAEMHINCWIRWFEALEKQQQHAMTIEFSDEDEWDRLEALRDELWTRIKDACRIESSREMLDDIDLYHFVPDICVVECPIGIVWPENPGIGVGK